AKGEMSIKQPSVVRNAASLHPPLEHLLLALGKEDGECVLEGRAARKMAAEGSFGENTLCRYASILKRDEWVSSEVCPLTACAVYERKGAHTVRTYSQRQSGDRAVYVPHSLIGGLNGFDEQIGEVDGRHRGSPGARS